ncbi:MAG: hypothetical protein JNG90_02360 [Planctomycetaceae bacterium]|nr:hypothetical protein [Planctomycetaceae bacterium]
MKPRNLWLGALLLAACTTVPLAATSAAQAAQVGGSNVVQDVAYRPYARPYYRYRAYRPYYRYGYGYRPYARPYYSRPYGYGYRYYAPGFAY